MHPATRLHRSNDDPVNLSESWTLNWSPLRRIGGRNEGERGAAWPLRAYEVPAPKIVHRSFDLDSHRAQGILHWSVS